MSDFSVDASALSGAIRALTTAPEEIAARAHEAVDWAGSMAASSAREEAQKKPPTAQAGQHLPKKRRVGDLARAVNVKVAGAGLETTATVRAGGLGPVILHGAKAHEIPRPGGSPIHHPGVQPLGWSYIDEGMRKAKPEIDHLMQTTGEHLSLTLANRIKG